MSSWWKWHGVISLGCVIKQYTSWLQNLNIRRSEIRKYLVLKGSQPCGTLATWRYCHRYGMWAGRLTFSRPIYCIQRCTTIYSAIRQFTNVKILKKCFLPSAAAPQNGNWGPWSTWSACSKACGGGKRARYRFCNNPFPAHGGKECSGIRTLKEDCNTESCPSKCIL